jgi:EAL domain-containing protein (putative c-di-GMP-specific phosphodiesterase class I)
VDDFIIGESSLKYLLHFPVSAIKLDASFLLREPDDAEETVLINPIISIAHKQQLRVMACCVETQQQLHILQEAGCDAIQGAVFSEPLSAIETTRLLQCEKKH